MLVLHRPLKLAPEPGQEAGPAESPELIESNDYVTTDLGIVLPGCELHEVPTSQLAVWVARVVETESPVHQDIVGRRIALAVAVTRRGDRIQSAMSAAVAAATHNNEIERRGEFLHHVDTVVRVRDRSTLDSTERSIAHICPEEIDLAIQETLEATHGVASQEIEPLVARRFGISRASKEVRTVISSQIQQLQHAGHIMERLGFLEWIGSPEGAQ